MNFNAFVLLFNLLPIFFVRYEQKENKLSILKKFYQSRSQIQQKNLNQIRFYVKYNFFQKLKTILLSKNSFKITQMNSQATSITKNQRFQCLKNYYASQNISSNRNKKYVSVQQSQKVHKYDESTAQSRRQTPQKNIQTPPTTNRRFTETYLPGQKNVKEQIKSQLLNEGKRIQTKAKNGNQKEKDGDGKNKSSIGSNIQCHLKFTNSKLQVGVKKQFEAIPPDIESSSEQLGFKTSDQNITFWKESRILTNSSTYHLFGRSLNNYQQLPEIKQIDEQQLANYKADTLKIRKPFKFHLTKSSDILSPQWKIIDDCCSVRSEMNRQGQTKKIIRFINKQRFSLLSYNLAMNFTKYADIGNPKIIQYKISEEERQNQLIFKIQLAMGLGLDFIFLQQAYTQSIRRKIRDSVRKFQSQGGVKYYYPSNLDQIQEDYRTTLILSKHEVNFGQMRFDWVTQNSNNNDSPSLAHQAFIEFQMQVQGQQQTEKICMLNCHLKSNNSTRNCKVPLKTREVQLKCALNLKMQRQHNLFYIIGDANMLQNQKINSLFIFDNICDAFDQRYSDKERPYSYYFVDKDGQVKSQRLDRVLMDKETNNRSTVKISTEIHLIKKHENQNIDVKAQLISQKGKITHYRLSDHNPLYITIKIVK